jgi:hypothetical protein
VILQLGISTENSGATTAGWLAHSAGRVIYAPDPARIKMSEESDTMGEASGQLSSRPIVAVPTTDRPSSGASSES